MKIKFFTASLLLVVVAASISSEYAHAQAVKLQPLPIDKSKEADVEFNSRRLLRYQQLWNLYLFRNEEEARQLEAQAMAMMAEDTQPAVDEEIARAKAEGRSPNEIKVALRPETSQTKAKMRSKTAFAEAARKEADLLRPTRIHAGLPPEEVSVHIEQSSKTLAKRLEAEIAAGGPNAEKAKANLTYLRDTLLPKLRDQSYFSVSRGAFAKEFEQVIGKRSGSGAGPARTATAQ